MKKIKFLMIGILTILFLSGCVADNINKKDFINSKSINYSYIGTLGSSIQVSVMFTIYKNKIAKGEIVYLKSKAKQSIPIIGTVKDDIISFYEFSKQGEITGILNGKYDGKKFIGKWTSPKTMKSMNLDLKSNSDSKMYDISITNYNIIFGTYQYSFPDNAGGIMEIKQKNNGLDFSIASTSSSLSVAEVEGSIATLDKDNRFSYGQNISKDCLFSVELYSNFAYVYYVDEKGDCDFGAGAGVDGIYYKTKD
jgi:hypothetical protein